MTEIVIDKERWRITIDGREVYQAHDGQVEVHASRATTKTIIWARRGGKDRCIVSEDIFRYEEASHQEYRSRLSIPFHVVYVVPNYKLAGQPWADLKAYMPSDLILQAVEDELRMYLVPLGYCRAVQKYSRNNAPVEYGGLIEVRSADNESSLQGFGADILVYFEAQEGARRHLTLLEPTLTDAFRMNTLILQGIPPEDPDHWLNEYFRMGQEGDAAYFSSRRTYLQNPWNTPEILKRIADQRRTMREVEWNRMYMAMDPPASDRPMDIEPCLVSPAVWDRAEPQSGHTYDIGVDLGKTVAATVFTIWDKSAMPWVLVYYRRMLRASWPTVKAVVMELQERWAPIVNGRPTGRVYVDSTGLDPIYDDLHQARVPVVGVKFTGGVGQERERLLDKVAIALEKRLIRVPREEQIVREFNAMRRVVSEKSGRSSWEPLEGHSSDCVFSCALGLYAMPIDKNILGLLRKPAESYVEAW